MKTTREEVILRKSTKKKVDQITASMVAQVQTRSMTHKLDANKASSMFIKQSDPKKIDVVKPKEVPIVRVKIVSKKWEPKKVEVTKILVVQDIVHAIVDEKVPITHNKNYQNTVSTSNKQKEKKV